MRKKVQIKITLNKKSKRSTKETMEMYRSTSKM